MAKLKNECHHPRCKRSVGLMPYWCEDSNKFCSAACRAAYRVTLKKTQPSIFKWIGARWKALERRFYRFQSRTLKPVKSAE